VSQRTGERRNLINTQIIQPLVDNNESLARTDLPDFNDPNVITHAPDSGAQALMAVRMVPKTVVPDVRRAVSTTVRTAASPSAAHIAR